MRSGLYLCHTAGFPSMKRYSAVTIEAIADALRTVYWYKNDLRSFLRRTGVPDDILASYDWGNTYKRNIINDLLPRLNDKPAGRHLIESIIKGLVDQDDRFPHLRDHRADSALKVQEAYDAQCRLRDLLRQQGIAAQAEKAKVASRAEAERRTEDARKRAELVRDLGQRFTLLASKDDAPQDRGREFERLLRDLFVTHDLDPRGGFVASGEQTDGSIHIDGTTILVEARWESKPSSPRQIREFRGKVQDKLETTLGLYISMQGFTDEAIGKAAEGRRLIVLMDGADIAVVFHGLVDFCDLLRRKMRHAAETGEVFYRFQP